MAALGIGFVVLLAIARSPSTARNFAILLAVLLPIAIAALGLSRSPVSDAYREAAMSRSYFFLTGWKWYDIAGALAPIVLFGWVAWRERRNPVSQTFELSLAAVWFASLACLAGIAVTWNDQFFLFARLQPMRAYQLIYVLMLLVPINLAIQTFVCQWRAPRRELAFAMVIIGVAAGMYLVQRNTFPASAHVEWPWVESRNPWQQAYEWIRLNTPKDAVFALDANYPDEAGNDRQGFRAEAERSALPDQTKDGGVAALFPELAGAWLANSSMTEHIDMESEQQTARLLKAGVSWVVVPYDRRVDLHCPYHNAQVAVCALPESNPPWFGLPHQTIVARQFDPKASRH
jgi:hypothetical protein